MGTRGGESSRYENNCGLDGGAKADCDCEFAVDTDRVEVKETNESNRQQTVVTTADI